MAEIDDISPQIRKAFEIAKSIETIEVVKGLSPQRIDDHSGAAEFSCCVRLPYPNKSGIPAKVRLRVEIPGTFPYCVINFYPIEEEVSGFAHQDAETRKLCLRPAGDAPWDEHRLACYLAWAEEWLRDAANDQLLCHGDPYELPDFSRRSIKIPSHETLFYEESNSSYACWNDRVGQSGVVIIKRLKAPPGIVPVQFNSHDGELVRKSLFSERLLGNVSLHGRWLLLPSVTVMRHRPAQTIGELNTLCTAQGLNIQKEIFLAWKHRCTGFDYGVILIGFPCPKKVGEAASEVHWQPLVIESYAMSKKLRVKKNRESVRQIFDRVIRATKFGESRQLPWGRCSNISTERLYSRAGERETWRSAKTVLCGCGALGATIAELLVRSSNSSLTLFDVDRLEQGNLCRHTLDGRSVGERKAQAIANRLSTINPLAEIFGYPLNIPLPSSVNGELGDAHTSLLDADVIIDCTTDEGAFIWLSDFSRRRGTRFASLFFNWGATVLTACLSGKHAPCTLVAQKLYEDIRSGKTPVAQEDWDTKPADNSLIVPGAGCWHATYPASGADVWILASAAVGLLNRVFSTPYGSRGVGVLIRRHNSKSEDDMLGPLVDIAWSKEYR